ncbi:hypothetical protein E2562_036196 [Oryza meyeriana var. granulata]|uniref:Transcription and mRNA export factor ENY2 n=1 Tax=Oryza meyeriana var. granulata TaxID=110450 RepID=A0A6G1ESX8_9ORYZ|nr:hypothetical protein E2562_036196 [Oryza meyeriana var. granulata]
MPGLIKPKQSRALKSARPKRRRKKVSHETKQEASKQEGEKSNPSMRASINRPPTPNQEEEPQKELSLREIINVKLVESGEKEKLMELLRERLVECGWRDEMKALCRFGSSSTKFLYHKR